MEEMEVVQGKFGNYFESDIKDDKTEEFFKSLEETLRRAGGCCLGEKPCNIKSPLIITVVSIQLDVKSIHIHAWVT